MISTSNVSKSYKTSTRPALDKVTVSIDKGEFVFLIGPSGSGKSTFMRLLPMESQLRSVVTWSSRPGTRASRWRMRSPSTVGEEEYYLSIPIV